tara:strand:- start:1401 stop:2741 length:1341 start_codon:yes stop_codon:yes gene_type:complete
MADEKNLASNPSVQDKDDGRADPDGKFPRPEYIGVSSVNNIARGTRKKNVYIGGSVPGVNLNLEPEPAPEYPNNQVKETASGHVIEYDDTYGRERVMIRHKTGSGVEMRADGTVIISSTKNTIRLSLGDEKVIIEGDVEIAYQQNVKMRVGGDFDLDVAGNYNINVQGDLDENIKGSVFQEVERNYTSLLRQDKFETIRSNNSQFVFGDSKKIVKGNIDNSTEGTYENAVKGSLKMTSQGSITLSTPDVNIVGNDVSVISSTGTFGGDNVTLYSKNIFATSGTFTEGVTAPTFHGDLQGTAVGAEKAGSAPVGPAHSGSASNTATNTTQTTQPTTTRINAVLNTSDAGVRDVDIDETMIDVFDKTNNYGGITKNNVTLKRYRSISKDPNNMNNAAFQGAVYAEGIISAKSANPIPEITGQTVPEGSTPIRGSSSIGTKNGKNLVEI